MKTPSSEKIRARASATHPGDSLAGANAVALPPPAHGMGFVDGRKADDERLLQRKFDDGVRAEVMQRKDRGSAETEGVRTLDSPAPGKNVDGEAARPKATPAPQTRKLDGDAIAAKEKIARGYLDKAIAQSADTIELDAALKRIQLELDLDEIEMRDLGTPKAAVWFRINPWFTQNLPNNKIAYRMLGTRMSPWFTPAPITDVAWESEELQIGGKAANVGVHMVARQLGPDFEAGSRSTDDKDQNELMSQLANSGTTSVPNDQKYIKGHLLNDHVGGPGKSFNLFPITADANAKHLAYVEKFVKAQLKANYVIYYEVGVAPKSVNNVMGGKYSIDSEFRFFWHQLNPQGQALGTKHANAIQSVYNAKGAEPFDVTTEYAGEYDEITKGKKTPKAIGQQGQWQESKISSAEIKKSVPMPTDKAAFTIPPGFFGSSGISANTTPDFSGLNVKTDQTSNVDYISVRNADASGIGVGDQLTVGGSTPYTAQVSAVSPMGGGWTRIYL